MLDFQALFVEKSRANARDFVYSLEKLASEERASFTKIRFFLFAEIQELCFNNEVVCVYGGEAYTTN